MCFENYEGLYLKLMNLKFSLPWSLPNFRADKEKLCWNTLLWLINKNANEDSAMIPRIINLFLIDDDCESLFSEYSFASKWIAINGLNETFCLGPLLGELCSSILSGFIFGSLTFVECRGLLDFNTKIFWRSDFLTFYFYNGYPSQTLTDARQKIKSGEKRRKWFADFLLHEK